MIPLVREVTCAVCGAPRTSTEAAFVVLCRYCGAVLTTAGDGTWREGATARRHEDAIREMVKPSRVQARLVSIAAEMARAAAPEDREAWRALAEERVLLTSLGSPGHAPDLPGDKPARGRYVSDAVALLELVTFDAPLRERMNAYSLLVPELARPMDTAGAADLGGRMLSAARAYYAAFAAHPGLPPGALREGVEHLARELVRAALNGYAPWLAAANVERIRTEVLGEIRPSGSAPACKRCGAPLSSAGLTRCGSCGAVADAPVDEPQLEARLALWELTKAELARAARLDGAAPVVAAVRCFLYTDAATAPEAALVFLQRAVPWLPRDEVLGALDTMRPDAQGSQQELLAGLRAGVHGQWTSDPALRPVAGASPRDFEPPSAEDEAAWVEAAVGSWKGEGGFPALLSRPLSALQIAAVRAEPTGVSPGAALRFFEQVSPSFDRAGMLAELRRLGPAFTHPRLRAFVLELTELLGHDDGARPSSRG